MATRKATVEFVTIGHLEVDVEVVVPDTPPHKDEESAIFAASMEARRKGLANPITEFFVSEENRWARTVKWGNVVSIAPPCPGSSHCPLVSSGRGQAECLECKRRRT